MNETTTPSFVKKIRIRNTDKINEYEELAKMFLRPEQFVMTGEPEGDRTGSCGEDRCDSCDLTLVFEGDKDAVKRELYRYLAAQTGKELPWGILTGIRPVKMTGELLEKHSANDSAGITDAARRSVRKSLIEDFFISEKKAELALTMYEHQLAAVGKPEPRSAGVYIGIPFCPTRCLYCSFASNQVGSEEIDRYLLALEQEIRSVCDLMKDRDIHAETIYVGGGTPTTLDTLQLERFMSVLTDCFDIGILREFTVEAGRPDTVTPEKLELMRSAGVDRVSINPQSMKQETLERIGRAHTTEDVLRAYEQVRDAGFEVVNMDLIAGLPGETLQDLENTLKIVTGLQPENITVHSLAVKRGSGLKELDENYHYRQGTLVREMLETVEKTMAEEGYLPYYLYRQKHMSGALENTGYARPGTESIYNIRIMDEHQHIIAMGAGGVSKVFFPSENRLERVANVTNYQIYIERIEEMIRRKQNAY